VKIYGKYGSKVSWIVKWYGKYGRKVSWIVKRYGKCGRKVSWIVKYWHTQLKKTHVVFQFIMGKPTQRHSDYWTVNSINHKLSI
jgi:hypothetical protein